MPGGLCETMPSLEDPQWHGSHHEDNEARPQIQEETTFSLEGVRESDTRSLNLALGSRQGDQKPVVHGCCLKMWELSVLSSSVGGGILSGLGNAPGALSQGPWSLGSCLEFPETEFWFHGEVTLARTLQFPCPERMVRILNFPSATLYEDSVLWHCICTYKC